MDKTNRITEQLDALAQRLNQRSPEILQGWRRLVESDPRLTSVSAISRTQFYDHIPTVIASFVRALRAHGAVEEARAAAKQKESAGEHGLVRWQQGFGLFEVMCEWRHLHLCLLDELEHQAANDPALDAAALLFARRSLAELCGDGVCESAEQYSRLRQTEAAGKLDDLEKAMTDLGEMERARAELWREAAHDLRGNLGVVKNAAEVLNFPDVTEDLRLKSLGVLQRSVNSLHALLNDLTSLARLEAGYESRKTEIFDAAQLLLELSDLYQSLAAERGLFLTTDGPVSLKVEGDLVKVRRIAQNLLLNALLYTQRGGIRLTWGDDGTVRWFLCVQDTGPGFAHGHGSRLAKAIREATGEVREIQQKGQGGEDAGAAGRASAALPSLSSPSDASPMGEGIGLSIVKRLCELLDASIELQSEPGKGTTFRVSLPRTYVV